MWGDDLRAEGVVVEYLQGIDLLEAALDDEPPSAERRYGVLVDHLVPGSKESRIAAAIARGRHGAHVRIVGHPWIDVWQCVTPRALGIARWPEVPAGHRVQGRGVPRARLAARDQADIARAWQRILGAVSTYRDLEPALLGRVEELIDFVTATLPTRHARRRGSLAWRVSTPRLPTSPHRSRSASDPVSFVRRSGRMSEAQERAWSELAPLYVIDAPRDAAATSIRPDSAIDPARVWGAHAPLVVEIGSGQGHAIIHAAASRPDLDFLAVEVFRAGLARTMLDADRAGVRQPPARRGERARGARSTCCHRHPSTSCGSSSPTRGTRPSTPSAAS